MCIRDSTKTQANPDDDEAIEVDIVRRSEALQMIQDGRIQDAKSILGLLRVFCTVPDENPAPKQPLHRPNTTV